MNLTDPQSPRKHERKAGAALSLGLLCILLVSGTARAISPTWWSFGAVSNPSGVQERTLALAPQPGTERRKTIERHDEFELTEIEVTIGENDMESSFQKFDFLLDNKLSIEVRDLYRVVEKNTVERIERRFERAELETSFYLDAGSLLAPQEREQRAQSPIEKKSVAFTRQGAEVFAAEAIEDAESAPFGRRERALLPHLEADLDFTAFLPKVPVEEGQSWQSDPGLLGPVFAPGGELGFAPGEGSSGLGSLTDGAASGSFGGGFRDFSGDVNVFFESISERDGQRIARLQIRLDVQAEKDVSKNSQGAADAFPPPLELRLSRFECTYRFDGTASLEWNLDARALESLEIRGEGQLSILQEGELATDKLVQTLRQRIVLSGPQKLMVRCEG